jgi:ssDNA-binding Zn-finger/Zn-ribbon topoisomerase 1
MPRACENCGTHLHAKTLREAKFFICHIVPKKHFKSVMVHPLNRWFGCWQCHSDYDRTWTKAVTMTVWPTVCIRFNEFMSLIKDTELRHLPDALRVLHDKIAPC